MGHYAPLLGKQSLPSRELPWGRLQAQGHCFRADLAAVRVKVQSQLLEDSADITIFHYAGKRGKEERKADSAERSGSDGAADGRRTRAKLAKGSFFFFLPAIEPGRQDLESRTSQISHFTAAESSAAPPRHYPTTIGPPNHLHPSFPAQTGRESVKSRNAASPNPLEQKIR